MNAKSLFATIDSFCEKQQLLPPQSRIILGLSGGPDSLFLLHYLAAKAAKKEISLVAAHLDHQWRNDSYKDVIFCQKATEGLGIRLIATRASDLSLSLKFDGSKEELGRQMRRHFLEKVRAEENADFIALAHHQQDQYETFFIRLFRGATISGLRGMRARHECYIRPLLQTTRAEIIAYLNHHNISYLIDPSNESPLFLRNRIRHQLLPVLANIDSRFEQNLLKAMNHIADADDCLAFYTNEILGNISKTQEDSILLSTTALLALNPYMQKRVLVLWLCKQGVPFQPSEPWLDEIIRFLAQKEGKTHKVHPDWSIIKKRGMVYCMRT